MRQQILGSHVPPCHRRMVITTLSSMFCLAALQRKPNQCIRHSRWLSKFLRLSGSARSHHPPTAPVSAKPLALWASRTRTEKTALRCLTCSHLKALVLKAAIQQR